MEISAPGAIAGRELAAFTIPAVVVAGGADTIENTRGGDAPFSLVTETFAVPTAATRLAGTGTVNRVALTKVRGSRVVPFHCTVVFAVKPWPLIVRVKAAAPGVVELGFRLESVGTR